MMKNVIHLPKVHRMNLVAYTRMFGRISKSRQKTYVLNERGCGNLSNIAYAVENATTKLEIILEDPLLDKLPSLKLSITSVCNILHNVRDLCRWSN